MTEVKVKALKKVFAAKTPRWNVAQSLGAQYLC
jgi:hypothetical protein